MLFPGLNYRRLIGGLLALVVLAGGAWLALDYFVPAPPKRITIAAGAKGGAFEFLAGKYREVLARSHVRLDIRTTDGTVENLRLLQDENSGVQIAFVQGGVSDSNHAPRLESLGRVDYLVFFIFCRAGEAVTDLTQFKGKHIAIGPVGSGTRIVAEKVLRASGVTAENTTFLPLAGRSAVDALDAGQADVLFLGNVLDAPLIQALMRDPGVQLLSLPRAKALARRFSFLSRLELPTGVVDLEKNIPPTDVSLIATTYSVLVRDDIHGEIVGLLARALQDIHNKPGVFQQFGDFPTQSDPEFPMSESALDFYKNGPAFLQRYLPFWIANSVRRFLAVLVTVLAIALPVFSYAPKLYLLLLRRHIMKLYRDLRNLESGLQSSPGRDELARRFEALKNIDRAAAVLPMRHSDLFFDLKMRIEMVRQRLDAAVVEAGVPTA
jgi:TRAP-type uncharacterized transport system substrate-binding protein